MQKLIYFSLLLYIGYTDCMRRRSSSITREKSHLVGNRPRSNSMVAPRRSNSDGVKKIRVSPKRKRSSSFLVKKTSNKKESSLVKKVHKAIKNKTITEDEVQALEFLIDVYRKNKQVKKDKKKEEVKNYFTKTKEITSNPTQTLYATVQQANKEIEETEKISNATYSKICLLLSMGAHPDEECESGKSPRNIASSPRLKKCFDIWDPTNEKKQRSLSPRRWTEEKNKILNQGVKFFD